VRFDGEGLDMVGEARAAVKHVTGLKACAQSTRAVGPDAHEDAYVKVHVDGHKGLDGAAKRRGCCADGVEEDTDGHFFRVGPSQ